MLDTSLYEKTCFGLEDLNGLLSQYITQHCSKETAILVRETVESKFNGRTSDLEIVEFQIEQLTQYLVGRNKSLQGIVSDLKNENSQLHADNQRKIEAKEQAEALVLPVQQENLQLRELLEKGGVGKTLIEKFVGERQSQEKKDLDRARQELRSLQIRYKQLEQEYSASQETSFFHKEPTPSTSKAAKDYAAVYTKLVTPPNTMNTMEQIANRVKNMIPPFSGEEGASLEAAVQKFLLGCKYVQDSITTEEEQKATLNAVIMRLHGDAFELVYSSGIKTFEELMEVIKDNYSRRRTLDSVTDEMRGTVQRRGEDLNHFARRLTSLHAEAKQIVQGYYTNDSAVFEKELRRRVAEQFVTGIANPVLKAIMITDKSPDFKSLVDSAIVKEISLNRGSGGKIFSTYGNDIQNQQLGYDEQNYFYQNPQNLVEQNRYCNLASMTNTGMGGYQPHINEPPIPIQMNYSSNNTKQQTEGNNKIIGDNELANITCSYCKRKGHVWEECYKRKNTPVCSTCGREGHDSNTCRVGKPNGQRHTRDEPRKCFSCGKPGHFAANCYSKRENNDGNREKTNPFKSGYATNNPVCYWCGGNHSSNQCSSRRNQGQQQSGN